MVDRPDSMPGSVQYFALYNVEFVSEYDVKIESLYSVGIFSAKDIPETSGSRLAGDRWYSLQHSEDRFSIYSRTAWQPPPLNPLLEEERASTEVQPFAQDPPGAVMARVGARTAVLYQ